MEEFIARENIRRFEAQLTACVDPEQRATLERLLEIERRRLKESRFRKVRNRVESSPREIS